MILTDKNFEEEVLRSDIPVLVDFWASWCPPCRMVEPIIDKLKREYRGRIKVGKLNVDLNPRTAARYNIRGVPTFIIFKDGKEVYRGIAAKSEAELRREIEKVLDSCREG
jgi:thioredoxin 1